MRGESGTGDMVRRESRVAVRVRRKRLCGVAGHMEGCSQRRGCCFSLPPCAWVRTEASQRAAGSDSWAPI